MIERPRVGSAYTFTPLQGKASVVIVKGFRGGFVETEGFHDGRHRSCHRSQLSEADKVALVTHADRVIILLTAALEKIAARHDEGGNEKLARAGSYLGFDEPYSVQVAREALEAAEKIA